MNFKTTFVLLIVFLGVGAYLLFTSGRDRADDEQIRQRQELVLDVAAQDVTHVVIEPAEGEKKAFERTSDGWRLVAPVSAKATGWAVDALVDALVGMRREGRVDREESSAAQAVRESPQYRVELTTKDGAKRTLAVGARSLAGNTTYVQVDGRGRIYVVPGTVHDELSKPTSAFRDLGLVDLGPQQIERIELERAGESSVVLEKQEGTWRITGPTTMPAEASAAQSLASTLGLLRAVEYVEAQTPGAARLTARITGGGEDAGKTRQITFGQWEDILQRNILVRVDDGPVATVGSGTFDQVNKTALDLRSREVLSMDPQQVQRVTVSRRLEATTQPTTRPASEGRVVVSRNVEAAVLGPDVPATQSTQPATQAATQATTQSTQPATRAVWVTDRGEVDEALVQRLLQRLNPLRVTGYREAAPTEEVTGRYELRIETRGGDVRVIELVEVKGSELVGVYEGLVFEAPGEMVSAMKEMIEKGG